MDVADEISRALEAARGRFPGRTALRWIAAESENVLTAMSLCLLQDERISIFRITSWWLAHSQSQFDLLRRHWRQSQQLVKQNCTINLLSVQHKCMQHSSPIISWHTCTRLDVRSAFFPPAPLTSGIHSAIYRTTDIKEPSPSDIDELRS